MSCEEEGVIGIKCQTCKRYLSYPPIMINLKGDSVCGRCTVKERTREKFIRNKAYEQAAKLLKFPCINIEEGCKQIIPFEDVKMHEEKCKFRKYYCSSLLLNDCKWNGCIEKIIPHCSSSHPGLLVRHPFEEEIDFTKNTTKNVLLFVHNNLFLFKIEYNIVNDNIFHGVCVFGDENTFKMFNYTLQIEAIDGSLKLSYDVKSIEENAINKTKISSLFSILESYDNLRIQVEIKLKEQKCVNCDKLFQTKHLHKVNDKWCCDDCKDNLKMTKATCELQVYRCPNQSDKGCSYSSFHLDNIMKHKKWLCQYSDASCQWGCNKKLIYESRFSHYANNYSKSYYLANSAEYATFRCNKLNSYYNYVLHINSIRFLCRWILRLDKNGKPKFNCKAVSDLPTTELKAYECYINFKINNQGSIDTFGQNLFSQVQNETCCWDYYTSFYFHSYKEYEIMIKIQKTITS